MAWLYLGLAGILEVVWALGLRQAGIDPRPLGIAVTVAAMILSFVLLALALRALPVGTAYAVWTGIGIVGTVIAGIVLYGEPADAIRLGSIALIVIGITGLRLA